MILWFRFFSHWPLWALHAIGQSVGWLAWLFSPTYRQRFSANVKTAGLQFSQVRGAIGQAGSMSTELPRLWMGKSPAMVWTEGSLDCVESAYAAGHGVLFLTPHLGCFEVTAQALTASFSAKFGPLTVLYRPSRKEGLGQVMEATRARPGLDTVPTTLAGVRQMIKALRAGRAVGLLPDQVPPEGMGQWTPFFGKPAYTMTLAARLALQTGAKLMVIWGERLPWGQGYRIHASELNTPEKADVDLLVLQINQAMERLILTRPDQYLWGYARYKQPRQESTG
ncbi:lysophospholipid acyltransferase family protein [Limnohabitans sp. MMS-10A-178]|uniref:lysophospholipid acyltransferase family protein n=1 Tax=Limnohabitans sp. MMS-10A-178 TaxID=1835767 RepID=UPI000D3CA22C|nr:lysophospholipid acyltransferase family protein [Limnohabitans sp. MMS-10A-178]PUE16640.1 lipid A biosynthesis acyltransferase [Limnohabitans sp. MMS-10A-178]